jgi:hypothetical protein
MTSIDARAAEAEVRLKTVGSARIAVMRRGAALAAPQAPQLG